MRIFAKATFSALTLACVTTLTPATAGAHVTVGFGFGSGYYGPPAYAYCNPRSRYYDPYRCDDYGDNYYGYNGGYNGYNGYNRGYYGYGGPVFSLYGGFHHDGFHHHDGFGGGHGDWGGHSHHDGGFDGGHGGWGGHHH